MNKYQQLKVAAAVLGLTMTEVAEQAECSTVFLRGVCYGTDTSARVEEFVDQKIAEADKVYQKHREERVVV